MKFFPFKLLKNRYFSKIYRSVVVLYLYWLKLSIKHHNYQLEKLGSEYGGWFIPVNEINSDWVVYSAGIGVDTTFDLTLIEKYQCKIIGIDPTPHSIDHVRKVKASNENFQNNFIHVPLALWSKEEVLRLYAPRTYGKWIGSYSAYNLQGMDDYIEVEAINLMSLMRRFNHNHIDLLKIDIEGAEYEVLIDMLSNQIYPVWLAVEFDQPVPFLTTNKMINLLKSDGYLIYKIDKWNILFHRVSS